MIRQLRKKIPPELYESVKLYLTIREHNLLLKEAKTNGDVLTFNLDGKVISLKLNEDIFPSISDLSKKK